MFIIETESKLKIQFEFYSYNSISVLIAKVLVFDFSVFSLVFRKVLFFIMEFSRAKITLEASQNALDGK